MDRDRLNGGRCFRWVAIFLCMLGLFLSPQSSTKVMAAQDGQAAGAAQDPAPAKGQSLLEWTYEALGWKYCLAFLVMSFLLVALFVMNVLAVRRDSICPTDLVEGVKQSLAEKNVEAAAELVRADDSFLGVVLGAGLSKLEKGIEPAMDALHLAGDEETIKVEHRLGYMALIGNVAPMVGLLGTVEGMVAAFTVIASRTTTPPPSELAKGISTALVTTLLGLYIAIPAIAIYNILRNRFQRLVLEAGPTSEELLADFVKAIRK